MAKLISVATKVERVRDILGVLTRTEQMAIAAQVPSVMRALNEAKNTTGYALAQLQQLMDKPAQDGRLR